jgi:hypothetical protein
MFLYGTVSVPAALRSLSLCCDGAGAPHFGPASGTRPGCKFMKMLQIPSIFGTVTHCCETGAGGAGAEVFGLAPAPGMKIHINCYKNLKFRTKI